jgi:hypothetical protein
MKSITPALVALVLASPVHSQLVITEINSDGSPADFWELTNFGAATVDLGNYKWDDDSANPADPAALVIPVGTSIAPGESMVFAVGIDATSFRSAWNLAPSVQVISGGPGLGQSDRVYLFNAANVTVTNLNYAAGGCVLSNGSTSLGGHAGLSAGGGTAQSMIIDPNFSPTTPRHTFATGGNFQTYAANAPFTGVGSPGRVGVAGSNSLPVFTGPDTVFWKGGIILSNCPFRITAIDSDPGQTLSFTVLSKPDWLTLTNDGAGRMRLGGTPPAPGGDFQFSVRASDNFSPPGTAERTYTLTAFAATAPILLNEYSAVPANGFLRGGDAAMDADGVSPGPTDEFFGRVAGNGGEWIEMVVTGSGTPASTVDMRGWKIDILSPSGTRTIALSQDPYWANVLAGTILTFTLSNTADGGLDTAIHRTSALHAAGGGFLASNIWVYDPVYVSQTDSDFVDTLGVGSDDTRVAVRNAAGVRIYGPSGEGVASIDSDLDSIPETLIGVSSQEILRLQETPLPGVDPLFGSYNDATTFSTFGAPNRWSNGATTQAFSPYIAANSPPRFTSVPPSRWIDGNFSYSITTSDPNGQAVTVSALDLPGFLTLTPGPNGTAVLSSQRAPTLAEAGEHVVRLIASDGQAVASVTPQSFLVTAFHTSPSVILNEYNAVAAEKFLNGGTLTTDSDGLPNAVDSWFGRVAGNGGRWFELVVTGNGGPSTVDLRGWTVEIGTTNQSGRFVRSNQLVLSNHAEWATVPAGSILTFIGGNTASGGLDTGLRLRDQLATHGHLWTNIWIGDPDLLVQNGPAVQGYTINGGLVEGLRINQSDTQFVIRDSLGRAVFGPVGEGIAPLSGVSDIEVLELEGNPVATLSPLAAAGLGVQGYDDGGSGSTFGMPNDWHSGDGGPRVDQDFTPFIVAKTAFQLWAESYELSGADAGMTGDPDLDGRDNFSEYAFGGNPALADAAPAPGIISSTPGAFLWTFALRDDPSINVQLLRSAGLDVWLPLTPGPGGATSVPHPLLPGYLEMRVPITPNPSNGREFFKASASPTSGGA